jgi:hypothetical protein
MKIKNFFLIVSVIFEFHIAKNRNSKKQITRIFFVFHGKFSKSRERKKKRREEEFFLVQHFSKKSQK